VNDVTDPFQAHATALGAFLRSQRELARLSLRQLADLTSLSHAYLSQVERGMHQPSVRAIKQIAEALNMSAETVLREAGLLGAEDQSDTDGSRITAQVTALIQADSRLSDSQKAALLAVYESMLPK
jgi:transcriptional regulator with XRE-family HTH domain